MDSGNISNPDDLWCVRSDYADFDFATLSLHLSSRFFVDGIYDLTVVPTDVLLHEAVHISQMTATATGVRLFSAVTLASRLALDAGAAASRLYEGHVALGLHWFHYVLPHNDPDSHIFQLLFAMNDSFRMMLGGSRHKASDLGGYSDRIDQDYTFEIRRALGSHRGGGRSTFVPLSYLGDANVSEKAVLLGAIHLLEGQSAAIQDLSNFAEAARQIDPELAIASWNEVRAMRQSDPYGLALEYFRKTAGHNLGIAEELYTFVLLVDTALMMDDIAFRPDEPYDYSDYMVPFDNFQSLVEVYAGAPDKFQVTANMEQPGSVQNLLLRALDLPDPDVLVRSILLRDNVDHLIENLPQLYPEDGLEAIRNMKASLDDRIDRYRGSFPGLYMLWARKDEHINWLRRMTSISTGSQLKETIGDQNVRLFNMQKSAHLHGLAAELSYGPFPCRFAAECLLPRRPACNRASLNLAPPGERCARETVIAQLVRVLDVESIGDVLILPPGHRST